jgi:polar amino acid transport system substrate-binding protein
MPNPPHRTGVNRSHPMRLGLLRPRRARVLSGVALAACLIVTAVGSGGATALASRTAATSNNSRSAATSTKGPTYDPAIHALLPKSVTEIIDAGDSASPPDTYINTKGQHVGYDPLIFDALGTIMGVKVLTPATNFSEIIPGILAGRYTTLGADDTAVREKTLNFVDFLSAGSGFDVVKGNPDHISQTTLCGRSVGIQAGSSQITETVPPLSKACVSAGKAAITLIVYPENVDAVVALHDGRVDSLMTDTQTAAYIAETSPGLQFVPTNLKNGLWGYGFKGTSLIPAVRAAAIELEKDGYLNKIIAEYHLQTLRLPAIMVNGCKTAVWRPYCGVA